MVAQGEEQASAAAHVPALDGLRGIAILMVLVIHLFPFQPLSAASLVFARATGLFWLGVDLFFVLSGYLITGILLRTRDRPGYYRNFIMRRTLRIFPAYFLVLGLVFFVLPMVHAPLREGELRSAWPWFVTYTQNWSIALSGRGFGFDWPGVNHFWSLAIEEQFYLVWPLVVAMLGRGPLRKLCVAIIVVSIALRVGMYLRGWHWVFLYTSTITRLDGLAAGALVATLSSAQARALAPGAAVWGGLALLGLALMSAYGATLQSAAVVATGISFATVAFGALLLLIHADALPTRAREWLCTPVLRWLGLYSYGLYLLHYVLYWPIRWAVQQRWPEMLDADPNRLVLITGPLTLAATLLAAWAMYRSFELPLLNLRDRLRIGA